MALESGELRSECQHGWVLGKVPSPGSQMATFLLVCLCGRGRESEETSSLLPLLMRSLTHHEGPSFITSLPPQGPISKYHLMEIRDSTYDFGGRHTHLAYRSGFWHPCPHFLWSSISPGTSTSTLHRLSPFILFPSLFMSSSFRIPTCGGHKFSLSRLNNCLSDNCPRSIFSKGHFAPGRRGIIEIILIGR